MFQTAFINYPAAGLADLRCMAVLVNGFWAPGKIAAPGANMKATGSQKSPIGPQIASLEKITLPPSQNTTPPSASSRV
jgi:hypothetical protein